MSAGFQHSDSHQKYGNRHPAVRFHFFMIQVPLQAAATLSHWLGSCFDSLINICPCSCASFQMLVKASSKSTAIFVLLCPALDIWSRGQKQALEIDATFLAWGQILNETSGALRKQKRAKHFVWKKMKGVELWWRLPIARTDNDPNDGDSMAIPLGMDELESNSCLHVCATLDGSKDVAEHFK